MQTKSEMINKIAELKAENERIKRDFLKQNQWLQDQKKEIDELKAENERLEKLKCKFKEYCTCNTEKYIQTLQEIKKYIARICKEECGYVQKRRCPDCDCRFGAISDLITKAEEE